MGHLQPDWACRNSGRCARHRSPPRAPSGGCGRRSSGPRNRRSRCSGCRRRRTVWPVRALHEERLAAHRLERATGELTPPGISACARVKKRRGMFGVHVFPSVPKQERQRRRGDGSGRNTPPMAATRSAPVLDQRRRIVERDAADRHARQAEARAVAEQADPPRAPARLEDGKNAPKAMISPRRPPSRHARARDRRSRTRRRSRPRRAGRALGDAAIVLARSTPSAPLARARRASSLTMNGTPAPRRAARSDEAASRNASASIDLQRNCRQAANGSSGATRSSRRAGSMRRVGRDQVQARAEPGRRAAFGPGCSHFASAGRRRMGQSRLPRIIAPRCPNPPPLPSSTAPGCAWSAASSTTRPPGCRRRHCAGHALGRRAGHVDLPGLRRDQDDFEMMARNLRNHLLRLAFRVPAVLGILIYSQNKLRFLPLRRPATCLRSRR